jgi:RNA polymerase sigma factor (sigma-70 family)
MSEHPSANPRSFAALLERVCDGSEDAAREFVAIYGPPILRVVRRQMNKCLRSKYDSIDFEQSVWASFFAQDLRAHKFEGRNGLVTYLVALARNKVIDAMRQRQTGKFNVLQEHSLESDSICVEEDAVVRVPTPSQVAVAKEEWEQLLKGRPELHQRILVLRHRGYSPEEIAAEMGVSVRTVRRLLEKLVPRLLP